MDEHHRRARHLAGILAVGRDGQRLGQHGIDARVAAARAEGAAQRHDRTRGVPGDREAVDIREVGQFVVDAGDHERHVAQLALDVVGELRARPAPHGQRVPGAATTYPTQANNFNESAYWPGSPCWPWLNTMRGNGPVHGWSIGDRPAGRISFGGIPQVGDHGARAHGRRGPIRRGGPRVADEADRPGSHPVRTRCISTAWSSPHETRPPTTSATTATRPVDTTVMSTGIPAVPQHNRPAGPCSGNPAGSSVPHRAVDMAAPERAAQTPTALDAQQARPHGCKTAACGSRKKKKKKKKKKNPPPPPPPPPPQSCDNGDVGCTPGLGVQVEPRRVATLQNAATRLRRADGGHRDTEPRICRRRADRGRRTERSVRRSAGDRRSESRHARSD